MAPRYVTRPQAQIDRPEPCELELRLPLRFNQRSHRTCLRFNIIAGGFLK